MPRELRLPPREPELRLPPLRAADREPPERDDRTAERLELRDRAERDDFTAERLEREVRDERTAERLVLRVALRERVIVRLRGLSMVRDVVLRRVEVTPVRFDRVYVRPAEPRMVECTVRRLEAPDTRVVLPRYTCGDVRLEASVVFDRDDAPARYAVDLPEDERTDRVPTRRLASFFVARAREAVSVEDDLYGSGVAPYFDLNFAGRVYAYPPPG